MSTLTRANIGDCAVELSIGDITRETTEAIVNAANSGLRGGGGVDGAIHAAAGESELLAATRDLGGCPTGQAKITPGYKLPARYIIHAVGPVYGSRNAPDLLASAYRRCLEVAVENRINSIAFPWISTGVYGYPMAKAAHTALGVTFDFLAENNQPRLVRFVSFSSTALSICSEVLRQVVAGRPEPSSGT